MYKHADKSFNSPLGQECTAHAAYELFLVRYDNAQYEGWGKRGSGLKMWQSIAKATAPEIALIRQLSLACRSITRRIRNMPAHFSCVALMEPRESVYFSQVCTALPTEVDFGTCLAKYPTGSTYNSIISSLKSKKHIKNTLRRCQKKKATRCI